MKTLMSKTGILVASFALCLAFLNLSATASNPQNPTEKKDKKEVAKEKKEVTKDKKMSAKEHKAMKSEKKEVKNDKKEMKEMKEMK